MKPILRAITLLATLLLAGASLAACSQTANDGRYATHDHGRSNNRA